MWKYNTDTRKLRIFTVTLFLLFTFFASTSLAETISNENTTMYGYNEYGLNIREEMDINSQWMGQYPGRSTIVILEDMGEWYRVENGYVMKEFVFPSIDIYVRGKLLEYAPIYSEPDTNSEFVGYAIMDKEEVFVQKVNGFVELESGGFIEEKYVTFSFEIQTEIKESEYTVEDMQTWNMPFLTIRYIGTLEKRTAGRGVTNRNTLYFRDVIPIYDIIDGEAYFPSGKHIYKISIEKFIEIQNVGPSYEILTAYRTVYYDSSPARKHNIELVSTYLDGIVISSGKTFSYNRTTGSRSASKGYQEAPVIENGQYVPGIGGGVCQVSTTIYAAILNQPKFRVTEREEHGLTVSYVPIGMDATVSYGSIDLKFVNENPFAVRLNVRSEDGVCLVFITRAD